ncbi:MAG TPA: 5'-nucleotidase C-terminal domain-containing protein [Jatrophihabitans sp.]
MQLARRSVIAVLSASALIGGLLIGAPAATAVDTSSAVVISELYGGGGNTGAPFKNDFIELYNNSAAPVSVAGWSVQYASSTGSIWDPTPLTGSVPAKGFYLIQEAGTAGGSGAALPTPNATGTANMSATAGKLALVKNGLAGLACGNVCSSDPSVADFLGYGFADDAAGGHPTSNLRNTTSAQRKLDPFTNTADNKADFTVEAPTPDAAPAGTGQAGPPDCTLTPLPTECTPGPDTIQDVQGPGFLSPMAGGSVTRVPGIVTAARSTGSSRGFFMQQATADPAKASNSSGIFVFSSSAAVSVGDSVLVTGKVSEFYPLSSGEPLASTSSLSTTELAPTTVTVVNTNNPLPAPLKLVADTVPSTYAAPGDPADPHSIEAISPVDPTRSAQEFFEAHEGMRVEVDDAKVVGPGKTQFGEIYVTTKPDSQLTPRGGTYIAGYDKVPSGRILVAPVNGKVDPANVGDQLTGATIGPVDWSTFGGYDIAATDVGTWHNNGLQGTVATPQAPDQLAIATYNVQNLAPSDPASKYATLAQGVVNNLKSPDIVSVEEIQDNTGATDDAVVAADQTIARFTDAIAAAGGPNYLSSEIDPVNDADGGQPGGNIRVVFLYNPARVTFVSKPGGASTAAVSVSTGADGTAELSASPGRVDPTNAAWTDSRKPLAGEFVFGGKNVIVVANHFDSKGGDQNSDGRYQPPARSSEVQRNKQAAVLNGFVKDVLAAQPDANIVLAGDFNDYQFSAPIKKLTDDGATLTDLINTLPENERYTYVFNGISQVLDHIFVSKPLADAPNVGGAPAVQYDVIHVNSEFAAQVSDHDPQVVRIRPAAHDNTVKLNLININDFHGRIDANTDKFAGTVEKVRADGGGDKSSLFLSAGDNIGASLFASAVQNDQPTIDVLNALGLNGSSVGNHEFDKGYDDLVNRVSANKTNAKWDYLGANVYLKGTTTPALPEYAVYTVNGVRVGVIGAVTQETPSLVSPGGITQLDIGNPVQAVNRVAAQLTDGDPSNGEADVLVAEYHEGASEGTPDGASLEQELAAGGAFADIVNNTSAKVAAIFTGHTHKEYAWDAPIPGDPARTRPVLQTGDYGANVGNVVLTVDRTTKQVQSYTSRNVPRVSTDNATLIATYPRVAAVDSIVSAALAKADEVGKQPVGKVTADITTAYSNGNRDDRSSESTLGNLVANALRDELSSSDRGGAQIGVVNPGGLRDELLYAPDGTITYAEANSVLPFVNNLWTLSLTGAQFKAVLEQMWQPDGSSRPFLNLGLSDNVAYTIDPNAARGSHITSITVNGAPIDPNASYRIGTFSFLGTGGDNFTAFTQATDVKDTGLVDRDAWIDYLGKNSPVSPNFARRGVVVSALPSVVNSGDPVAFTLSKLDLTSLGSPANTSVTATIGDTSVGSFAVAAGAASINFTVPSALTGAQTLSLVASPSNTTVTIPLTITAPPQPGTVRVSPDRVKAGKDVKVRLAAWAPHAGVTISLDGTRTLGSATTNDDGAATVSVDIPRATSIGHHIIQVSTPDGATASANLQVSKACVPKPGRHASLREWLEWLVAILTGNAC